MIWMGCLSYLAIGLAHVVVGPILDPLIRHYGVDYNDGGQLIMNQFFGFLVGVLVSPWLLPRLGRRRTLLLALGCLTVAETIYSFLPPWGIMLTVGPAAGFGFGMVESVIGAMILAFLLERKASAMSRLEVFFGLGALAMPSVAALLLQQGHWALSFPVVAALSGLTWLLWLTLSFGTDADRMLREKGRPGAPANAASDAATTATAAPSQSRAGILLLAAGSVFFFLYVGTEMSFANYMPSILHTHTGVSESASALAVSLFWGAMAAGRWMIAPVADNLRPSRFLILTSLGTAVSLVLLPLTTSVPISFALILIQGLIMAGMFTMGLVFLNNALPGTEERTTSILVACGGLGGALLPKLTGIMMDRFSPTASVWLMAGGAAGMLLVTGLAIRFARSARTIHGGTLPDGEAKVSGING